jgi:hypothetical protein
MPPGWLAIKQARPDVTDYLIHWTHRQNVGEEWFDPLQVLKLIIKDGFLKPTFAPRSRFTVGGVANTIKGKHPAVCFTEQPLAAFIRSCKAQPARYHPYGVAVRKDRLFAYGGRPALYGDDQLFRALPEELDYLWARFQPIPESGVAGYPLDFTHEREWRARVNRYHYLGLGTSPGEGVPLLLPPSFEASEWVLSLPWILVKEKAEAKELRQCILRLPNYSGSNGVLKYYFKVLPQAFIVPLDEVESRLQLGDTRWSRLDTLPYEELDPGAVKTFTRIGWKDLL